MKSVTIQDSHSTCRAAFAWTGVNYEPRGNQLPQLDFVTHSQVLVRKMRSALLSSVRSDSSVVFFFSAGLSVQVVNLEALRQLLEVRLAADLRLEVFMPAVLPHFSPPSDAITAVPPDPARLGSTGPDSMVTRTGMLVPAVLGS